MKHPHLLNGGKHPPVMIALDHMLFTPKGDALDLPTDSGKKWLQELVKLGASLNNNMPGHLYAMLLKSEEELETHQKELEKANAVSIPSLIQLKGEAQAHVVALENMTVKECYGPFIEAAEQQILESRRVAACAGQFDRGSADIAVRVETMRNDLEAVSVEGTHVGKRDSIRARIAGEFPVLKADVDALLTHAQQAQAASTMSDEGTPGAFSKLLTQFTSEFDAVQQRMKDHLQLCVAKSNDLFSSLNSCTQPPENITEISTDLRSASSACSPSAFRAETERLCPRVALADAGEEAATLRRDIDSRADVLRGQLARMQDCFSKHVEQPLQFARTTKEAGMKLNALLDAADEVDNCRHVLNKAIKAQLRFGSAADAAGKVAEATTQKQHAMQAYRSKASLYIGPLLRHFPEYRQALTEGLQLPTVVTAADSPMDPLLTLEDFTVERNLTDDVTLAMFKADSSRTPAKKRRRDDDDTESTDCGGQKCVLKRYSDELQLIRELTAMRRVQHPFVATVKGAFYDGGHCYLWMPRYEGGRLTEWLQLHQGDAEAVLRVLYQMASGLSAVHTAGVIHCDIKPANVMMTSNSVGAHPCLIDFDFAAPDGGQADGTMGLALLRIGRTMVLGGTRQYLAPEMCDATVTAAQCTSAVDAYALGVVLWADVLGLDAQVAVDAVEYPSEAEGATCADTLRPYKDELMSLITRLTARNPSERCTVAESEGVLRGLWERARAERHDEVATAQRPVACVTCMGQQAARQTAECRGGHRYCGECAVNLVGTQREAGDWMEHYRKGGVKCFVTGCTEVVPLESLEAVTSRTDDGAVVLRQMAEDVGAAEAVAAYKRQQESESAVRKALRELDETVLNLRCPSSTCGKLVHIDFTECMSLTCPHCRTIFCAWCSATQRNSNEGHRHVANCRDNMVAVNRVFCYDPAVWWRHWEGRRRVAVERYLSGVPEEVAAAVRPLVFNNELPH